MSSVRRQEAEGWQAQAACAGRMGAAFYPPTRPEKRSVRNAREQRAKEICALCPVRTDCLDHALTHDERYGIWGGLTGNERKRLAS